VRRPKRKISANDAHHEDPSHDPPTSIGREDDLWNLVLVLSVFFVLLRHADFDGWTRLPTPDSRLQTPDSRLQTPDSYPCPTQVFPSVNRFRVARPSSGDSPENCGLNAIENQAPCQPDSVHSRESFESRRDASATKCLLRTTKRRHSFPLSYSCSCFFARSRNLETRAGVQDAGFHG